MTPASKRVQHARGEHAVARVQEWPNQRQGQHPAAARPAADEGMGVPGEVGHRTDGAERHQAAFHAPKCQRVKIRLRGRDRDAPVHVVAVGTILGALITQR